MIENETGEQTSNLTRNFSVKWGFKNPSLDAFWSLGVWIAVVAAVDSEETFRHLKKSRRSDCLADSSAALRFARAARRFASARFLCSSVISMDTCRTKTDSRFRLPATATEPNGAGEEFEVLWAGEEESIQMVRYILEIFFKNNPYYFLNIF